MLDQVERGQRLRELRNARKLTQKQIGDHFGITDSAVGQWENGKTNPTWTQLPALDRLLEAGGQVMALYGFHHPSGADLVLETPDGQFTIAEAKKVVALPEFVWREFEHLEQRLAAAEAMIRRLSERWELLESSYDPETGTNRFKIRQTQIALAADSGKPDDTGGEQLRSRPSPEPEPEGT